jgi:hypothetical protein
MHHFRNENLGTRKLISDVIRALPAANMCPFIWKPSTFPCVHKLKAADIYQLNQIQMLKKLGRNGKRQIRKICG